MKKDQAWHWGSDRRQSRNHRSIPFDIITVRVCSFVFLTVSNSSIIFHLLKCVHCRSSTRAMPKTTGARFRSATVHLSFDVFRSSSPFNKRSQLWWQCSQRHYAEISIKMNPIGVARVPSSCSSSFSSVRIKIEWSVEHCSTVQVFVLLCSRWKVRGLMPNWRAMVTWLFSVIPIVLRCSICKEGKEANESMNWMMEISEWSKFRNFC